MLIPYREQTHGSFNEEWNPHRGANDWWYVSGYLRDENCPKSLYSYQFTVINPGYFKKAIYVLDIALTDMQTGEHFFKRKMRLANKNTGIFNGDVVFLPFGLLQRNLEDMILTVKTEKFEFNLILNLGKGAVWQCDNGVLAMGLPDDPVQRTVYYSYTNMPTSGSIKITDTSSCLRELSVTGKSWFDRQWGPFRFFDSSSFWEWFSIRFFDNEEVMLFAFPQHPYCDGTFIDKDRKTRRIHDFKYSYHSLKKKHNSLFSRGWDIVMPGIKEENYRIFPMNDAQYNQGYYEMMANVTRMDGTMVGYCFVELLPCTRQQGKKFNLFDLVLNH